MDGSTPGEELVRRWRGGDQAAARELFECYARRLTSLAERHLGRILAGRLDGEDIVQSVFRTFFQRSARGEFRIESSVELWQLLIRITLTKVWSQRRRHTAAKRDVHAETSDFPDDEFPEAIAGEPGPDEAAALVDQIEALLRDLPETYCQVLALRLEGYSRTQIAAHLKLSRQTIHRALSLMRERLERDFPERLAD